MGGGSPEPAPTAPPTPPIASPITPAPLLPSLPHPFSRHSCAPPPSLLRPSLVIPASLPVIPAQAGTPTSPQSCYHTPRRTKVRSMPTSQNTDQPRAQTAAAHAAASLRTTPNKPEQIRTNPNTVKRPDQIGPPLESPPNTPKKENPNSAPERSTPPRARAAAPLRTTPNKPEHCQAPRPDRTTPRITPEHPEKKENPNSAPERPTPPRGRRLARASRLRSML